MSINSFLIQIVGFSCLLLLLRARQLPRGWVILAAVNLLVLGVAYYFSAAQAGWIGGSLWGLLIVLPLNLSAQINRLVAQERYRQARKLGELLRWLHPMDGLFEYPELLRGLELGKQGNVEAAMQIFERHQTTQTPLAQTATALLYRLGARWDQLISWVNSNFSEQAALAHPVISVYYLRALGETGELNRLVQAVEQLERKWKNADLTLNLLRMFALAFCGQPKQVQMLFNSSLAVYSANWREFWLATAELAAGDQTARQRLQTLSDCCEAVDLQNAIRWRLTQPLADAEQSLTDSSRQILSQFEIHRQQEARYGRTAFAFAQKKVMATYGLIGINGLVFALEIALGGSQNPITLYKLGALVPAIVIAGEWWRLLAATFLHFGWLHLMMNMLGLYFFGAFVEATLGVKKFLIAYLFSGIGSMLVITGIAWATGSLDQFTVGASGAIMGLCGTMGTIFLRGWWREKAKIASKHLRFVLFIVGVQFISDLMTPQVSIIGHSSGLILGFLAGLMLTRRQRAA